jgi:hypothetical protein
MNPSEICPGLWRWTSPHPEWRPDAEAGSSGDWPQAVGSVLYEAPQAAVFIDPLVPPDAAGFWRWAGERVAACGGKAAVLITIHWHRRSGPEVVQRFGASLDPPSGVVRYDVPGADETMFWLPRAAALVPGDRLVDLGQGLQVCPDSWLGYLENGLTGEELRAGLRPLADLSVERIVLSHGEPVLHGGRDALAAALNG